MLWHSQEDMATMVLDGAALDLALHGIVSNPRAYLLRFYPDAEPPELDAMGEHAQPADVEVNAGVWIWRCTCSPTGGGIAFADCPLGWCVLCSNVDVGGSWRPLRFPDEREQIDAVLAERSDGETRNWWPGETVDDLVRENVEHGLTDGVTG